MNINENITGIYNAAENYKKEMQEAERSAKAQLTLYITEILKENGLDGKVKKLSGYNKGKVGKFEVEDGNLAFVFEDKRAVCPKKTAFEFVASNWLRYVGTVSPKASMERVVKGYGAV